MTGIPKEFYSCSILQLLKTWMCTYFSLGSQTEDCK